MHVSKYSNLIRNVFIRKAVHL